MPQPPESPDTFVNPIDKDKVAINPGMLPYAHSVGSALIKPEDKGKIKGRALKAMYEQTGRHMDQIRRQIELLAEQAGALKRRVEISEKIYQATVGFEPHVGQVYHLYARNSTQWTLSMVAPDEWGPQLPYEAFIATVCLLADHTWDILEVGDSSALD
ncbi:MAG: hypothetical protein OHK0039_16370 [Bacteroidia bacterium]